MSPQRSLHQWQYVLRIADASCDTNAAWTARQQLQQSHQDSLILYHAQQAAAMQQKQAAKWGLLAHMRSKYHSGTALLTLRIDSHLIHLQLYTKILAPLFQHGLRPIHSFLLLCLAIHHPVTFALKRKLTGVDTGVLLVTCRDVQCAGLDVPVKRSIG